MLAALLIAVAVACSGGGSGATATSASASAPTTTTTDPLAVPGCIPLCFTGLMRPGPVPAGTFTTRWFFGGKLQITTQGEWTSHEDSSGEFALSPVATPANEVYLWLDVWPFAEGKRVQGVAPGAAGLLAALQRDDRLVVSNVTTGSIGALPATVFDLRVSDTAVDEEKPGDCPTTVCVLPLSFEYWDGPWGIAKPQVQRFYLADVSYSGTQHLFVAVVYPDKPEDLDAFAPVGAQLLATVQVPVAPA